MTALPRDYDAWRLASPDDEADAVGVEDGELCNRLPEPDDDAPRRWRPRRCTGAMVLEPGEDTPICDTCGAMP